jgi:phospholipase C
MMSASLLKRILVTTALSLTLASLIASPSSAVDLKTELTTASTNKTAGAKLAGINNFVIIYLENHSFDNLFGTFPGANGIANASSTAATQISMPVATQAAALAAAEGVTLPAGGQPLATVNPVNNSNLGFNSNSGLDSAPKIEAVDQNFGTAIPNGPWAIGITGTDAEPLAGATGGLGAYNALTDVTGDLVHRFYEEQVQIDGGKMDRFIAGTHASPDAGGLVMSYYAKDVASQTKLWALAQNNVLLDNFFHSAFGGSFLNHSFLVCGCAFTTDSNATVKPTQTDSNGMPLLQAIGPNPQTGGTATAPASVDTQVSADGKYWVNTSHTVYLRTTTDTNNGSLVQPQTMPHIGDRLNAAGLSWKWYSQWYKRAAAETQAIIANSTLSGGTYTVNTAAMVTDPAYNYPVMINGVAYGDPQYASWGTIPLSSFNAYMNTGAPGANPDITKPANYTQAMNFQWHHNPFAFFADLAVGSAAQKAHLQDRDDFLTDIANNTLPNVTFYKPGWMLNQHPGYSNIAGGDNEVQTIVTALQTTNSWKNGQMMIIITYDENGGQWDHAAPPARDAWGPGTRVPALVISPAAKTGYIDHTSYDTGSILRTIETRWNLPPLTSTEANVNPLTGMLK